MLNILSYVGVNLQSEVCIFAVLGIIRTMFDGTLFKVDANLKEVWQMQLPVELTYYVQRVFRTMITGVVLVQCFTVYVYLAAYIILLYPAFLEERPALVIPWLLLAAVRSLLCELFSLALGLAACVLMGPARPACLKFLVQKIVRIMPSVYMWMVVYWYYYSIKLAAARTAVKSMVMPHDKIDTDGFLELAVRRRRTKSLLKEEELRKIITKSYDCKTDLLKKKSLPLIPIMNHRHKWSTNVHEIEHHEVHPFLVHSPNISQMNPSVNEEWFNIDVVTPRDTDRVLDQFVTMLLKIRLFLAKGYTDENLQEFSMSDELKLKDGPTEFDKVENHSLHFHDDEMVAPPAVGSNKGTVASYLRDYSQIFMKKTTSENRPPVDINKGASVSNKTINIKEKLKKHSSENIEPNATASQYLQENGNGAGTSNADDIKDVYTRTLFDDSENSQYDNESLNMNITSVSREDEPLLDSTLPKKEDSKDYKEDEKKKNMK